MSIKISKLGITIAQKTTGFVECQHNNQHATY